jgi:uncharacterized protein (TIGR02996 family)
VNPLDNPDWRAMVAAVRAAPDDDLPRLVAADWLDERGLGERAEFIRVQCELAKTHPCGSPAHCVYGPGPVSPPGSMVYWCGLAECAERHKLTRRELALLVAFPAAPYWQVPDGLAESHPHRDITATADAVIRCFGRGVRDVRLTYARGFVSRVECEAAVWWGGACECVRRWEMDATPTVIPGGCYQCGGTGRTAGVWREIVAAHPVAEVVLVDREPDTGIRRGDTEPTWTWFRGESGNLWAPHHLHPDVWDSLPGGRVPEWSEGRRLKDYDTAEDARAALSAAALAWASAPPPNPKADLAPRWGPG